MRDLEDAWAAGDDVSLDEIVDVALACGVLCRHTAFVAVDAGGPTVEGSARTIVQPVALPAGWAAPPVHQQMAGAPGAFRLHAAPAPAMGAPSMAAAGGAMPVNRSRVMRPAPSKTAAPAKQAAPERARPSAASDLDRVLDEIGVALADPSFVPDRALRNRWARVARAESRSAGLLGRRSPLAAALHDLAQAITRWEAPTRDAVAAALAAVRTQLAGAAGR